MTVMTMGEPRSKTEPKRRGIRIERPKGFFSDIQEKARRDALLLARSSVSGEVPRLSGELQRKQGFPFYFFLFLTYAFSSVVLWLAFAPRS